ncbi:MAG: M48 family metalloprotease [Leptolyngbya sp. SIO1E4]|nr:M48 family metalloprotease [Leptolyngbya sp. SIO1E4]
MSETPPSTSKAFSSSEGSPEETLKQGLAALKQKHYTTAIRCLAKLSQNLSASGSLRLKARVGLVQALKGNDQIPEAIALCQKLEKHPQPKVQQWAKTTLAKLTTLAVSSSSAAAPEVSDRSGFQPLEPSESTPLTSGGVPASEAEAPASDVPDFEDKSATAAVDATAATTAPNGQDIAVTSAAPSPLYSPSEAVYNAGDAPTPQTSLFHYERLNDASFAGGLPSETALPTTEDPEKAPPSTPSTAASEPSAASEPLAASETPAASERPWQFSYAGRLERLRTLPVDKWALAKVWGIQAITVIVLFWVCRAFTQWALTQVAKLLRPIAGIFSMPLGWQYQQHTFLVLVGMGVLLLASPWLLDWLLGQACDQKALSIQKLKQTHPEGCRLLRRIGQQRGWLLPVIRELPTEAPLIFSYGWLPRYSRIVVSRGLLNRLDDEEFATLIGYELTHFTTWTVPFMSLVATLLLLLHQGYWQTARWGDRYASRFIKTVAAALSAFCYALYWVVRKVSIPLSRVRVHLGDRQATEWTGNPNALVRALIKLEVGIAETLCQSGYTPPLVESTDLLTPCGYETAISLGSIYPDGTFPQLLNWDIQNPYRHWLAFNSSHPLLGERRIRLTGYALRWQLAPEMPVSLATTQVSLRSKAAFWDYWWPFLQQISPYIGPLVGVLVAMVLWFLGGIFNPLGVWQVSWLYGDQSLLRGSLFIGLGVGIMVRINRYFPDIIAANRLANPTLPSLLKNPMALPTDSRPLRLQGTLMGRQGIANWLCQDLILQTPTGLLKLHFLSSLGAIGNLFMHPHHPIGWVGRSLEVQGWFRRGAIAWLDVDSFLKSGKVVTRGNHPVWSVLLSLASCALGLYILLQG